MIAGRSITTTVVGWFFEGRTFIHTHRRPSFIFIFKILIP